MNNRSSVDGLDSVGSCPRRIQASTPIDRNEINHHFKLERSLIRRCRTDACRRILLGQCRWRCGRCRTSHRPVTIFLGRSRRLKERSRTRTVIMIPCLFAASNKFFISPSAFPSRPFLSVHNCCLSLCFCFTTLAFLTCRRLIDV